jgi:hypothetical protein
MCERMSRRDMMTTIPVLGIGVLLADSTSLRTQAANEDTTDTPTPSWPEFPHQDPRFVEEMVGRAHFDEQRVRDLADAHPALVNAWWDWGFGDWESPLGAAAHTGRRSIAEFLLERGARIDIFAAAMLGYTEVVKAFVSAQSGVQRTLGPHGIPLLAHAQVGGEQAKETVDYLESLGDANQGLMSESLPDDQQKIYLGQYRYGAKESEVLIVHIDRKGRLSINRSDGTPRQLFYTGDNQFFPSGVPSVRIRFSVENNRTTSMTIIEQKQFVKAIRISA